MRRSEAEFAAFVAARRPQLRRIAYALCGDWHRAEDLVQTALAKLYVAWPRIHKAGAELVVALQGLTPMQRRAVVLRHWLDLSVEQTAAELGVSTGTVKSHTSRGLAALHAALTADLTDSRSAR